MIKVKAPGRICLIGEHQDYFELRVVSAAFNRFVVMMAEAITEDFFEIHLRNIGSSQKIKINTIHHHLEPRDYLKSGLNVAIRNNLKFSNGYRIIVNGDLPIGKGVSSSSAFCVAWITLLFALADNATIPDPIDIAKFAFETEVLNFNEPGGMQDHLASAIGGAIGMDFTSDPLNPKITPFCLPDGCFFLGDSKSRKNTLSMLSEIKDDVLTHAKIILEKPLKYLKVTRRFNSEYELLKLIRFTDLESEKIKGIAWNRFKATVINRNLTAWIMKTSTSINPKQFGSFMNTHQHILSKMLRSSSKKIDYFCRSFRQHDGWGAKIVGSGGGGVYLVFTPVNIDDHNFNDTEMSQIAITQGVTVQKN